MILFYSVVILSYLNFPSAPFSCLDKSFTVQLGEKSEKSDKRYNRYEKRKGNRRMRILRISDWRKLGGRVESTRRKRTF